jgi:iron-sulfur cluster assembly accessory protein
MNTTDTAEPIISLTEAAAREIEAMTQRDPTNAGKPLRLFVEAGGCSGLQYGMIFDEVRAGDRQHQVRGVQVVVDEFSANYLNGAVVEYSDALTGGGFKISNPNARQSCGCGRSFEA